MKIYTHSKCNDCLIKAACSCVCESYKKYLKRKYNINVEGDPPLELCEEKLLVAIVDMETFSNLIGASIIYHPGFNKCSVSAFVETSKI
jgi:hypothetical protein